MSDNESKEPLDTSLIETLSNSDLRDVGIESAEVLIDSFLTDGVLREIPIVRSVVGLVKAGVSIRDRLFLKKVFEFLSPLKNYSAEQRRTYLQALDAEELKEASQCLILYLDRLDAIQKASMLSKVFQAYMTGRIDYRQMLYFAHFIDSVFILVWQDYHAALKDVHSRRAGFHRVYQDDALALQKVGFYKEKQKGVERMDRNSYQVWLKGIERELVLTDAGWQFIQVVFEFWPHDDEENRIYRSLLSVTLKER